MGIAMMHPVPHRGKPSFVIFWHPVTLNFKAKHQSDGCQKLQNNDRSGTGCFIAVGYHMTTVGVKGFIHSLTWKDGDSPHIIKCRSPKRTWGVASVRPFVRSSVASTYPATRSDVSRRSSNDGHTAPWQTAQCEAAHCISTWVHAWS